MSIEKQAPYFLKFLFHEFLKAPTVVYSISPLAKKLKIDAVEMSDHLLQRGLIRERWVFPDNSVGCRITVRGIEEIDPVYVRERLSLILGNLVAAGGSASLLEILEDNLEEYSIALDIVQQLELMKLVRLQHPGNSIVIELTDEGRHFYERSNRTFLSLLAY